MGIVEPGQPIRLKAVPEYIQLDPSSQGGPKYGHLSQLDPAFAAVKEGADAAVAGLWESDDWTAFRAIWTAEAPLPADCPKPGVDVTESYRTMPTRDGHTIELKVMKSARNANRKSACVLRMHGGGWAIGWHGTEAIENLHAAAQPDTVLVSVDYRLAPEWRFPVPLHDCVDAFRWVQAHADELGIDPARIVLLGGSAGSNLALCLALKAREEGLSGIVGMALDWPTGAHPKLFPQLREQGYELESYVQNADASVVCARKMEFFLDAYTPVVTPDPYHSPLLADSFAGLPPAFIQVAGYDPLRDEGLAIAEKLKKDGVPTELHVYAGLPHCFSMMFTDLPQAKDYQARQNAFLAKMAK